MKIDKDQMRMVLALFVVAVIAAAVTGVTDIFTREPIAAAQKEALHKALQQVLPQHSNDPQMDKIEVEDTAIYPAKSGNGGLTGLAWEVIAPDGYSGSIRILVGLRPDASIQAIRITGHKETPGLGDGITKNQSWLAGFMGQTLASISWAVKKDGGDFDQFTGATITPRAVVKAVQGALMFFRQHEQVILARITAPAVSIETDIIKQEATHE
ncbi:MAG: RnfABCDGE type electron transport complex subunit G [Mariprofundus sp.]|nr:RnfABCDGE type electron transport complex subunit G [Mariprofundus sp.]